MDLWLHLLEIYLACGVISIVIRFTLYQPDNQGKFWRYLVLSVDSFGGVALGAELVFQEKPTNVMACIVVFVACLVFAHLVQETAVYFFLWRSESPRPKPPQGRK